MQVLAGLVRLQPVLAMLLFNIFPGYATGYSVFVYASICATLVLAILLLVQMDGMKPARSG